VAQRTGYDEPVPLPRGLAPMLATAGGLPRDEAAWTAEVKWDGVRVLAAVEDGALRLTSRNGNDVTGAYPELQAPARGRPPVLLDGEVVAMADGRSDFGLLQSRMHVARPSPSLVRSTPVTLVVFDVLHVGDSSLLQAPLEERRAALEGLGLEGGCWSVPPTFPGAARALHAATEQQGLEGVVVKRLGSRYEPGRRSDCWIKVKHVKRQSAVVGGWKPGEGGRAGRVGSLLLGVQDGTGLVYAGHVGTGFSAAVLRLLGDRLAPLRRGTSPFAGEVPREHARSAVWVEPELVCDVEFTAWTREGRLRHPSFKGLRDDLDPGEVVRE
jgi:bifunctional non-homologous end joining protein LigD